MPAGPAEALRGDPRYVALPAAVLPDTESLADVLSGRVSLVVTHSDRRLGLRR